MPRISLHHVALSFALMQLGRATDYYCSPNSRDGDLSLEECIKKLIENDQCLLRPGHYFINERTGAVILQKSKQVPRKNITLAALQGRVLIDGTAELQNLNWKRCSDAQEEGEVLDCAQGVWVANVGSINISQLFMGDEDPEKRRLLFPARWPNPTASDIFNKSGLPAWAPVTDTYASWSFPDGSVSGRMTKKNDKPTLGDKRKPGAFAKFVDNGGALIEKEEEVEEDQTIIIRRQGPGFLNESNVSVEGANIVIVYGKGSVESGKVYKHRKGSNEFEIEHPQCNREGYGSCGKGFWKSSFVSYFFENSLELLDQPYEYYFQFRQGGGSRLFLKLEDDEKPNVKLWTKHADSFLKMMGSSNFTVRGIKTFATSFTTGSTNSYLKVLDSTFLYASAGKRNLGDYSNPRSMLFSNAHDGRFVNNTWMYAEGTAFEAKGNRMTMSDNLFRYNGIFSIGGPQTIKWTSTNGTVSHNSLQWNGQVTGWKLMGEGQLITKNHVQHQNWGKTLHDGAGIHVQMSAGASEFSYNWVHDGHASLGIRFDTSKDANFTKPEDIGHDANVHHNVLWGKTHLAMKGERMTVVSNTIVDKSFFSVIRAFGNQQQMHKLTVAKSNAFELKPSSRGKIYSGRRRTAGCVKNRCMPSDPDGTMPKGWENKKDTKEDGATKDEVRPQGPAWELPPGISMDHNYASKGLCWDGLEDCMHHDFRPKKETVFGNGAYDGSKMSYWLPGRREQGPSNPVPPDRAKDVPFGKKLGLAFLPSERCRKHKVSLSWEGRTLPITDTLENGANLWEPGKLPKNKTITWSAMPANDDPLCDGPTGTWTFTTAQFEFTTSTTSTTTTTTCAICCEDEPPKGVTKEKNKWWCTQKLQNKKCNIPTAKARCKKTCNHCEVDNPAPTPATTPVPTPPPGTTITTTAMTTTPATTPVPTPPLGTTITTTAMTTTPATTPVPTPPPGTNITTTAMTTTTTMTTPTESRRRRRRGSRRRRRRGSRRRSSGRRRRRRRRKTSKF